MIQLLQLLRSKLAQTLGLLVTAVVVLATMYWRGLSAGRDAERERLDDRKEKARDRVAKARRHAPRTRDAVSERLRAGHF